MATSKNKKKPYSEYTDAERVKSNWTKTCGLYDRGEYSVAIVRAATTAELMTNLAIRHELVTVKNLPAAFVDSLLKNSNGIVRKFSELLVPILEEHDTKEKIQKLSSVMHKINTERNKVAHRGEFKKELTSHSALSSAHKYVTCLAEIYATELEFDLPPEPKKNTDKGSRRA